MVEINFVTEGLGFSMLPASFPLKSAALLRAVMNSTAFISPNKPLLIALQYPYFFFFLLRTFYLMIITKYRL